MIDKFKLFGDAVRTRFAEMAQDPLFVVSSDPAEIWAKYLASFPPGSNPIFRTRTEHDCSCCRHFLRDIGNVVGIQNGALTTIWDLNGLPSPYQEVADAMSAHVKALLAWMSIDNPVARFRNTAIGTLVQDLSEGVDVDAAVRAFEAKVAPQNYKRPTALITKAMVRDAMKTIHELDLEAALDRRHARLSDVDVNSVLFVDNSVRGRMRGGIADRLMEEVKPGTFDPKRAEEISIDDFIGKVLPKITGLSLYLDNSLSGNFVSLTAPAHADSGSLFKWRNDFAWSYDGNVTDSIKERVKRAGGQVENVAMRVSLAWFNTDDLDLHVIEPDGNRIFFGNRGSRRGGDGLDVDMNVGHSPLVRDAVENTRWPRPPMDGTYQVLVHNFTRRESIDVGFVVDLAVLVQLGAQELVIDAAAWRRVEAAVQDEKPVLVACSVFEVLADKTKCEVVSEQLSGVGFSSTLQNRVTVVAMGPGLNKPYTIVFGRGEQA